MEDTTKEVRDLRYKFKDFKVVDYDDNYIYLRKDGVGVVEGRILRGSLGSYDYKFVVEKFGERNSISRFLEKSRSSSPDKSKNFLTERRD